MDVQTANKQGLMNCPVDDFLETALEGLRIIDDYIQLATDMQLPELVIVYVKAYDVIEKVVFRIKHGDELTQPRRNMVRCTIKQAMKLASVHELK